MTTLEGQVRMQAVRDAITHQDEFPGEPLTGDWDTDAWFYVRQELELTAEQAEALWPIYHDTLKRAIECGPGAI